MPSARAISMMDVHMSDLLLRQMLAEEGPYLVPAIHRLLGPIERAVPVEEAVAGAVVVAKQAEQWTAQVLRHVDRRDGRLRVELLLGHHYAATPLFDAGIDVLP